MLGNNQFSLKSRRKNKICFFRQLPFHILELQNIIQQDSFNQEKDKKIIDFIDRYNLVWLRQIWLGANKQQKKHIANQFNFKFAEQNQIIANFKHTKQIKQILVLLEGTVGYKFNFYNRQHLCHHPSRPGQILYQPYPVQLQFKQFSYVATSLTLLLIIPFESSFTENILKTKQQKLYKMLNCLSNYQQLAQQPEKVQSLAPFFSQVNYKKGEIIHSKNTKSDFLCYITFGQIQILKQSKTGKNISMVQMTTGRFFYFQKTRKENQNISVVCKSFTCQIYLIPFPILDQICPPITKLNLMKQAKNGQNLHNKIFNKNQKILANPFKLLKKRKKRKSGSKSKKFSLPHSQSWDLIGYMANQMKKNIETTPQIIRYTKSAHVTKRSHTNLQYTNSIQRLKLKLRVKKAQQDQQLTQQNKKQSAINSGSCHKSLSRSKSNFLASIPRTVLNKVNKETKLSLVKKTKFKLLRYAKGQNLYGVCDYL